ncbi:MAG TPA: FecR domain-containing protein [Candidatus Angelobacter sp.]|nr:FecR domain-containing protein [Candidatus Angelobacter sp.]
MATRSNWKFSLLSIAALCLAALPALGDVPNGQGNHGYPGPGALNYVQGSAFLQGQQVTDLGNSQLAPGQVLHTTSGKAEVLLTPGVFLRLDSQSAVKMISPDISNTRIELLKGEAGVEVDEIQPQNNLEVVVQGVATRLVKRGFYEFAANPPSVLVFTGEAQVDTGNGNRQEVKKDRKMLLTAGANEKPQSFNAEEARDDLFQWSKLRSDYLAQANRQYATEYGYSAAPGWYWNPWTPGWDWAWGPRWGWGMGWGWRPGWGWGGPAYWGGPVFHYHLRLR